MRKTYKIARNVCVRIYINTLTTLLVSKSGSLNWKKEWVRSREKERERQTDKKKSSKLNLIIKVTKKEKLSEIENIKDKAWCIKNGGLQGEQ